MFKNFGIVMKPAIKAAVSTRIGPFEECGSNIQKVMEFVKKSSLVLGLNEGCYLSTLVMCDVPKMSRNDIVSANGIVFTTTNNNNSSIFQMLETVHIPEGLYATMTLQGSYSHLPKAWGKLAEYANEQGLELITSSKENPAYETYLNDPQQVKEDEILTELFIPIKSVVPGIMKLEKVYPDHTPKELFNLWIDPETQAKLASPAEKREKQMEYTVGAKSSCIFEMDGQVIARVEETCVKVIPDRLLVVEVKFYDPLEPTLLTIMDTNTWDFLPNPSGGTLLVVRESILWFDGIYRADMHKAGHEEYLEKFQDILKSKNRKRHDLASFTN